MLKIFLIFLLSLGAAQADSDMDSIRQLLITNEKRILDKFSYHHRQFSKKICRPGTEEKFWKLFREYQGSGYYLPKTVDDQLDRKTLNRFYPEIIKKRDWILSQKKKLKKMKSFSSLKNELASLEEDVKKLITYKEAFEEENNDTKKLSIRNRN